ncbi:tetratricopeptide repeat protein [Tautonia plasticadhaerens]|uniref:Cellulose synthase subunit BcsC n=1 Tax=Tautonia plasticadhaerens TaxID=2527974 RepID=A0A518H6Z6_9BACT|nr:tetratricopeptide repeat protein [Tautonia plasticadhaerens]QDV36536.1 cellulose synthase subunit BcsC [Tautonia plasticadhaerens]
MSERPPNRPAGPRAPGWRHAAGALALISLLSAVGWLCLGLPAFMEARAARAALAAGRLDDATTRIDRWLRARPGDAEAWFLKARVDLGRADAGEALRAISRARSLGYPDGPTRQIEGIALARSGQAAAAEPLLRQAMDASTGPNPEVARELARIYLNSYRIEAATPVLSRWAREAPDDPTPHLWQVEVDRRSLASPQVIIDRYREALARDPGLEEARLGLADALRSDHRLAEAREVYEAYLRRHPESPAALLGLGLIAAEQGDDDEAADHLRKAAGLDPDDPQVLAELAAVALRRGDLEGALASLDEAIRRCPQDFELLYRRGLVLDRLGRPDQAARDRVLADRLRADQDRIKELRDRLVRSPLDPQVRFEVASWMMANGHEEEGLRWAEQTARDRPDHAPTCRLLADYFDRRGQADLGNFYRFLARSGTEPDPPRP